MLIKNWYSLWLYRTINKNTHFMNKTYKQNQKTHTNRMVSLSLGILGTGETKSGTDLQTAGAQLFIVSDPPNAALVVRIPPPPQSRRWTFLSWWMGYLASFPTNNNHIQRRCSARYVESSNTIFAANVYTYREYSYVYYNFIINLIAGKFRLRHRGLRRARRRNRAPPYRRVRGAVFCTRFEWKFAVWRFILKWCVYVCGVLNVWGSVYGVGLFGKLSLRPPRAV